MVYLIGYELARKRISTNQWGGERVYGESWGIGLRSKPAPKFQFFSRMNWGVTSLCLLALPVDERQFLSAGRSSIDEGEFIGKISELSMMAECLEHWCNLSNIKQTVQFHEVCVSLKCTNHQNIYIYIYIICSVLQGYVELVILIIYEL